MNTLVIFELVLVLSAIISLLMMRRTYFPMNLFWGVGVVSIGLAAALGALVYGGFGSIKPYHTLATQYAGSIGIASFALAAIGGAFAPLFHKAGWWIVLIAITSLAAVLLFDVWKLSEEVRYGVVGLLGLVGLYRVTMQPNPGFFLFLGVVLLIGAGLGASWIATQVGLDQTNVYHMMIALSVLSFGAFAAKE